MRYGLNLETISSDAYQLIHTLDRGFVGSDDYMGLAYFWAYEYRYPMRDATITERRRVHRRLLELGLELDGESDWHVGVINRYVNWDRLPYQKGGVFA